ncbi:Zn-ribbon domain-containing OB-fold protein [Haladaptatus sp.]|uniref:Zn-ribbon domain-containing OB-fold protein n=1 Tax=Haladaptatus sp. TaxID=1973141 RepID=UPI003C4C1995
MSSEDGDNVPALTYADWRAYLKAGDLVGLECESCGTVTATPKRACVECGDRNLDTHTLPNVGVVHSETTITVPPVGFEGPYQVAVVDLGDTKILGRIGGDEEVNIGTTVECTDTVELDGMPAPMFEPVE